MTSVEFREHGRRAGLIVPLFAARSSRSWGIGEIPDLIPLAAWCSRAGQRVLQLLPLNEMAPCQQSPYSAISAMAIDPIYISVPRVDDIVALGGEAALSAEDQALLARASAAPRVDYDAVRAVKHRALSAVFEHFFQKEWLRDSGRARALRSFIASQGWWLDDYALFRAIHAREGERPWSEWPDALQRREPAAMARVRRTLEREIVFHQYLQWIADLQWQEARTALKVEKVDLFGDLPFMVDLDSADVWARQQAFRLDLSLGVPPDAFSPTGQDWGMPAYDWTAFAAQNFQWLRDRARRSADLYDGYRVDHLVGFYRTYGRPRAGGDAFFLPADEPEQRELGERVLQIFRESGAEIIAEDLGVVPDFVRASLDRQGVPGFRVMRWERYWHDEGQPFRDPAGYPAASVAASGTHDTETLAAWWETMPEPDREKFARLPTVVRVSTGVEPLTSRYSPPVRDVLLESLFASGSSLLLLPIQDVFGWSDRINEPATVSPANWTFCLPWPCDRLDEVPEARERQARLRQWSATYRRL